MLTFESNLRLVNNLLPVAAASHVIFNSALDRPRSQYFCCMLAANAACVEKHPAATKRVIRAVLKAADHCISELQKVARFLVDGEYTEQYDYALQPLAEIPCMNWRDTGWRLFNELKRELKT